MKKTLLLSVLSVLAVSLPALAIMVSVSPHFATVPVGESIQYEAAAYAEPGQPPIPVDEWTWSVAPESLGTISETGLFEATHMGQGHVQASCVIEGETYTGMAMVHVEGEPPPPQIIVEVFPHFATVAVGAEVHYTATAHEMMGPPIPVDEWTWSVEPESLGTISETGVFVATHLGQGHVIASCVIEGETYTGMAMVHVIGEPPPPQIIVDVFPHFATVAIGGEVHFTATAHEMMGPPIPVDNWTWSVEPESLGTISETGVFEATHLGQGHVIASCVIEGETYTGMAMVHVMGEPPPPPPIFVTVFPCMATVPVGGELQFIATARNDPWGPPIPVDEWTWTVEPESLGTISETGLFEATHVGMGHVYASCVIEGETYTGSAWIHVMGEPPPPPPIVVSVCPWMATVPVGGERQFFAWAHHPWQPPIPVDDWTWSVEPAELGTVSDSGLFVAAAAGEGHVIASCVIEGETYSGFAVVHVIGEPPPGGTISGTVTNEAGEPIAGAHVRAFGGNMWHPYIAVTGDDGTYELANLPVGTYILRACAFGYIGEYWDNQPTWHTADEIEVTGPDFEFTADFELADGPGGPFLIAGTVRDDQSNPIADAFVFAVGSGSQLYFAEADPEGNFALQVPEGQYQVWSEFPNFDDQWYDHAPTSAQAWTVEVGAVPSISSIDFDLIPVAASIENPGAVTTVTQYRLDAPYPNPFNPTTTLTYSLAAGSDVTLKVYDVLGREVATLVNDHQNAGDYRVTFDASHLASGNYFLVLNADGQVAARKMTLLK